MISEEVPLCVRLNSLAQRQLRRPNFAVDFTSAMYSSTVDGGSPVGDFIATSLFAPFWAPIALGGGALDLVGDAVVFAVNSLNRRINRSTLTAYYDDLARRNIRGEGDFAQASRDKITAERNRARQAEVAAQHAIAERRAAKKATHTATLFTAWDKNRIKKEERFGPPAPLAIRQKVLKAQGLPALVPPMMPKTT